MVDLSRREIIKTGLIFAGVSLFRGLDSLAESTVFFPKGKKGIGNYLINSHGKEFLKVGNLDLEVVNPEETGDAGEYLDPSKTGVPIIRVPSNLLDERVSRNFTLGEFAIVPLPSRNKGTDVRMTDYKGQIYHNFIRLDPRLVEELQEFRSNYGRPLKIISPFRNFTYNQKCGGKKCSRHLSGQAADIQDMNENSSKRLARMHYMADKQFKEGGVGYYPRRTPNSRFIHVDVRGSKARWSSKKSNG